MYDLGKIGENAACDYLKSLKYIIIARNFHSRFGEIDLIARQHQRIIFIEVKTRKSEKYRTASEAVNYSKLAKITKTAHIYLKQKKLIDVEYRFDVVEVIGADLKINHIQNITL